MSIHSLCHDTQGWHHVHPVSTDHLSDVFCWKSTHLYKSGHKVDSACQSTNQAMKSKELDNPKPPRQDCMEALIWGRLQKKVCSFEGLTELSVLQHL